MGTDAFRNILYYVDNRAKYGESDFFKASKNLNTFTKDDLQNHRAKFHASYEKQVLVK